MKWFVELKCLESVLLSFLCGALQEQSCMIVTREKDCYTIASTELRPQLSSRKLSGYFLVSSEFEALATDREVVGRANQMLPLLNAIVKAKCATDARLEIGEVLYADSQDRLIWSSAFVTARLYAPTDEQLMLSNNANAPTIAEIWKAANIYPEVEEAMRHYANEKSWFNLYKVFEVIEHDVDKSTFSTWTQGRASRFTYSANNARASGDTARHSSATSQKIAKHPPMLLTEGHKFITDLLLHWLSTKPSS